MKPYYQDDFVTLYHGDCLEVTEWLEADVLVTDPPYGIKAEFMKGDARNPRSRLRSQTPITSDDTTDARDSALAAWGERPAAVFGSWRQPRPNNTRHRLIWWKQGQPPGPARAAWVSQDEEIYIMGKGWLETSPPMRTVFATSEIRQGATGQPALIGHPTPKPLPLMEWVLGRSRLSWVVADPFAGSGSTLVAAKRLGRRAIGVELEEKYCEIAANRLAQDVLDLAGLTSEPSPTNTLIEGGPQ